MNPFSLLTTGTKRSVSVSPASRVGVSPASRVGVSPASRVGVSPASRVGVSQKSEKGIALILAMFTIILVSYLATELAYETNVEYLVNSAAIQRVKSYYAARAGVEISLLRIKIYSQVTSQLSAQAKGMVKQDLLDMIWKMPFSWPPQVPGELNQVQKEMIDDKTKLSPMDAAYMTVISDEGSKINVNGLWGPSKSTRDLTYQQLLRIFQDKIRDDEKWARAHQDLRPEELINNLEDWVSPSGQSAKGGDKTSKFSSLGQGYPPNRGFRTVREILLVPGMLEDYFSLLEDQITVFGMNAINPNNASKEILMAIDPAITSKVADEIIKRRDDSAAGGPFKDAADFWAFVTNQGARIDPGVQKTIPIITDAVYNFRITSTGSFKNSTSEITAVVYDLNKSSTQGYSLLKADYIPPNNASAGTPPPSGGANNNNSSTKGPPRIVYWSER